MLHSIQSHDFFLFADTKSHSFINQLKHDRHRCCCPCQNRCRADELEFQLLKAAAIEQAVHRVSWNCIGCEQSDRDRTPKTIEAVYGNGTYRVIHMHNIITEPNTEYHKQSCHSTDHQRADGICHITGSRNCHKSCKRSIQTHGYVWFFVTDPSKDHTYHSCHCRRDRGCHENRSQL